MNIKIPSFLSLIGLTALVMAVSIVLAGQTSATLSYLDAMSSSQSMQTIHQSGHHLSMAIVHGSVLGASTVAPWKTLSTNSQFVGGIGDYNMGYSFTVNQTGQITQLALRVGDSLNHTVWLYNSSGNVLASVQLTAQPNTWVTGNITPVSVTAGSSYVVSERVTNGGSQSFDYEYGLSLPKTTGGITVNSSIYGLASNTIPVVSSTYLMFGEADVVFTTGVVTPTPTPIPPTPTPTPKPTATPTPSPTPTITPTPTPTPTPKATPTPTPIPSPTPTSSPTPTPTPINNPPTGHLDGVKSDGTVYGWSYDSDNLNLANSVDIYLDKNAGTSGASPIARVTANGNRSDVGNHAFNYTLPSSYQDGKTHQAWVWGIDLTDTSGAHNSLIPGSPVGFSLAAPTPTPTPTPTIAPTPTPSPTGFSISAHVLVILENNTGSSTMAMPYSQSNVQTYMNQVAPFFNAASYGNITMTAVVTPWLSGPNVPINDCGQSGTLLATNAGYIPTNYTNVVVLVPSGCPDAGQTYSSAFSVVEVTNLNSPGGNSFVHELSAQFFWNNSLNPDHGDAYYCNNGAAIYSPSATCQDAWLGDLFTPFGGNGGAFNAYNAPEQKSFGWLMPQTVSVSGTYTISPLENSTGIRALQIGPYYLEYRQPIGVDNGLSGNPVQGVVVHLINGVDTEILNLNPGSLGGTEQAYLFNPALPIGQTFTDAVNNISFTVVSANSSGATVQVQIQNIAPVITSQPMSQTVNVEKTASFAVYTTGNTLAYQWYKNSVAISGATNSGYTTPATTSADNGSVFSVVVTNQSGAATSSPAVLTVNVPPVIATQPLGQTVTSGQTATFSVVATGPTPLTYQWYKTGVAISGATNATYTTPATVPADNHSVFQVLITSPIGSIYSNSALLTLNVTPTPTPTPTTTITPTPTSMPTPTATPTPKPTDTPTPSPTPTPTPTLTVTPTPTPISASPLRTLSTNQLTPYSGSNYAYNMGYKFTPSTSGTITQLSMRVADTLSHIVTLYNSSGQVLAATTLNGIVNTWVTGNVTPVALVSGASYTVSVQIGAGSFYYEYLATPLTSGNITISTTVFGTGSSMPSNPGGSFMYGEADVVFTPKP